MKKKILLGLLILFVIIAVALGIFIHILREQEKTYITQNNLNAPIEIPATGIIEYSEDISDEKPMAVMFYVDWCTYCRRYMPIFGEISQKYNDKFNFVVVNCDYPENQKIVKNFHIMGYPSLFIIDKKLNHSFTMNMAAMTDKKIMQEELDQYLKFRKQFVK